MNLRSSAFAVGCLLLALQVMTLMTFSYYWVQPNAEKLERSKIEKDLHRGIEVIQRELFHLEQLSQALSDQSQLQSLVAQRVAPANAVSESLQAEMVNFEVNLICVLSGDRKVLWENIIDLNNEQPYPKQSFLNSLWKNYPTFLEHNSLQSIQAGIYNSPLGPMWIVSTPVSSAQNSASIQGTLIIGKLITREVIQLIQSMTYTTVGLLPLGGAKLSPNQQEIIRQLGHGDTDYTVESRGQFYRGYMALPDLSERPSFLLSTIFRRDLTLMVQNNMIGTIAIMIIFQTLLVLCLLWVMKLLLMQPLAKLTQQVENANKEKIMGILKRNNIDEISQLIQAIQGLMTRQEALANHRISMAHRQGSSEAQHELFLRFEDNFHRMIEEIETLDKKLFNLPTSDIEWIIAESRTGQLSALKLAENTEKLQTINDQLRLFQKESRRLVTDLYAQALRNAAALRLNTRNAAAKSQMKKDSRVEKLAYLGKDQEN